RRAAPVTRRLAPTASVPDLSGPAGPLDPWGLRRQADDGDDEPTTSVAQSDEATSATMSPPTSVAPDESAAWLRADVSNAWSPGQPPQRRPPAHAWEPDPAASDAGWLQSTPSADDARSAPAQAAPEPGNLVDRPTWPSPEPQRSAGFLVPSHERESIYSPGEQPQSAGLTSQRPSRRETGEPESPWQPTEPPLAPSRHEAWPPAPQEPSWPADDEENAIEESADDAPTAAVESLASAFAPWKDDGSWKRPQFPRYGPPSTPDAEDDR
ncbi:MAG: hypothetical protein ACRDHE_11985, partial [Ktedonobacterales bacterium]